MQLAHGGLKSQTPFFKLSRWVRTPFLVGSRKMGAQQVFLQPSAGPSKPKHFGWPAKPAASREEGEQGGTILCLVAAVNFDIFFL